ncbi:hypothetical protein Csa_021267 [Cucumis sativus]|uniref:Uncharacterized protein n=1 Tax=Cucumis sativus TaxID=3659 RepID=A0A0A0LJP8_CUCSA|nr:hypothetical protein Csa_021267 [Cucumis sativus]
MKKPLDDGTKVFHLARRLRISIPSSLFKQCCLMNLKKKILDKSIMPKLFIAKDAAVEDVRDNSLLVEEIFLKADSKKIRA